MTCDFPRQERDIPSPLPPPLPSLGNVTTFLLAGTISSRIPEGGQAAEDHAQSAPDTRTLGGAAGNGAAHNDFRCGFGVASGHRVITWILTEGPLESVAGFKALAIEASQNFFFF